MLRHPMYTRGNIYLSGGIQYAKDFGADWRVDASSTLKGMGYYPIDICHLDRQYAKKYGELYIMNDRANTLQYKSNIRRHFVQADLQLIERDSDALIVFYDESARRGAGTISECQHAYNYDLPIFIMSSYQDWQVEVPGWLQALGTKVFTDFPSMYAYLGQLPIGILKKDVYGNLGSKNEYLCSLCGDIFQKTNHHFVSKIRPLYCKSCVDLVTKTYEQHTDRYEFFVDNLEEEIVADQITNRTGGIR